MAGRNLGVVKHNTARKIDTGWIAKVTSSLHDLLPVTEKSCKTKFRISWAGNKNPEVNFTNIAET